MKISNFFRREINRELQFFERFEINMMNVLSVKLLCYCGILITGSIFESLGIFQMILTDTVADAFTYRAYYLTRIPKGLNENSGPRSIAPKAKLKCQLQYHQNRTSHEATNLS